MCSKVSSLRILQRITTVLTVHVESVTNGLDCGCSCPHCGGQLIAKKGNVRVHYFVHYNAIDCENGAETAIHLMAKKIIVDRKSVDLPATYFTKWVLILMCILTTLMSLFQPNW
jgi:hypothetical protein